MLLPISDTQVDALVEQRIAEMSDKEFNEMCSRTRPPQLGASSED